MREAPSWKGDNPGALGGLCARSDGESRGKAKRKGSRKNIFAQSLGNCAGAHLFLLWKTPRARKRRGRDRPRVGRPARLTARGKNKGGVLCERSRSLGRRRRPASPAESTKRKVAFQRRNSRGHGGYCGGRIFWTISRTRGSSLSDAKVESWMAGKQGNSTSRAS